jgi:hypothetical protein
MVTGQSGDSRPLEECELVLGGEGILFAAETYGIHTLLLLRHRKAYIASHLLDHLHSFGN